MFKVNNKDSRATLLSLFFCLYFYFTPCSSVSIVNVEQINAGWQISLLCYQESMLTRRTLTTEILPFDGK